MSCSRSVSPQVIAILRDALGLQTGEQAQLLSPAIQTLSTLFTRKRAALGSDYLENERLANGYLAYFLPVNLAKIQVLLEEIPDVYVRVGHQSEALRVLDVGSGPGSATLGLIDWIAQRPQDHHRPIEVVLIDRSRPALKRAEELLAAYRNSVQVPPLRASTLRADLERTQWYHRVGEKGGMQYDLIIMANCLNELFAWEADPSERRAKLVARLLGMLRPDGTLLLVEPATRAESRQLHKVRDALLTQQACNIYSPCLHEAPCPALLNKDDWCHEERFWEAPWFIEAIDKDVGLIKDALKFSYLVLRKDGRTIVDREQGVFRVVSELRHLKGEKRAWLCNETGRTEVGRLDRAQSDSNRALEAWHRGAIVKISEITRKGQRNSERTVGRISAGASVEIVRRA